LPIDGEPIPFALVCFASAGDHRASTSVGARTKVFPPTEDERRVSDRGGFGRAGDGLLLVGSVDVIREHLTEVNVTSPTGIRELDRACRINTAAKLRDAIARITRSA